MENDYNVRNEPDRGTGFQFFGKARTGAKALWRMDMKRIPEGIHSIIVECYGACGGIYRFFPRGRSEMSTGFRFPNEGKVAIFAFLRDSKLRIVGQQSGVLEVVAQTDQDWFDPDDAAQILNAHLHHPDALPGHGKPPMADDCRAELSGYRAPSHSAGSNPSVQQAAPTQAPASPGDALRARADQMMRDMTSKLGKK